MKFTVFRRIVSICLLLILLVTGCAQGTLLEEEKIWKIGVVLKTMESEHWQGIRSGMEHVAKENNVNLTLFYPSNEWAEDEQEEIIKDVLKTDIDALIIAPCNSTNTGWICALAEEARIELFTVDTRSLDRDIPYIGIDNQEVGRLAAKCLEHNLQEGAKVAVLAGSSKQAQTIDRVSSFEKELFMLGEIKKEDIRVDAENSGFGDVLQTMKEFISEDIKSFFCTSAVMGMGAVTIAEEMGVEISIVSIDTQDDALKAVQSGKMKGLITHSGYEVGETAITTVVNCLKGKEKENVYVECELLTKENIDEYLKNRGN